MTAPIKSSLRSGGRDNRRNADVPWDTFTPDSYKGLHYSFVRKDDRRILEMTRDFFARADVRRNAKGIDAGCGPNLYPTLAMLPFCSQITLLDISKGNVSWLRRQQTRPDPSWQQFWEVLCLNAHYQQLTGYKHHLRCSTNVQQGSLFDLPSQSYDIGTMFFVAESLSTDHHEFCDAVRCFVGSLRHEAPFAIAFMRGSEGYRVDEVDFPAVAIDAVDVKNCLEAVATQDLSIIEIPLVDEFRSGYEGMMLALGRAT
jgi:hypothetical protein